MTLFRAAYHRFRYGAVPSILHSWRNVFCYKPMSFLHLDYDAYWAGNHSAGFETDPRTARFLRLIVPRATVAEIGCGDGTLLALLTRHLKVTATGYDVSPRAVDKAKARGVDAEVRDATTHGLDPHVRYDYIVIADCLEHLARPEALLANLRGRFRIALLISVPNSCYWRYRFRVLFGSFMVQWVAHPGEHLRFWSIRDMHWWLHELGYHARKTYPTWGIPFLKYLWPSMCAQNVIYVVTDASLAQSSPPDAPTDNASPTSRLDNQHPFSIGP